MKDQSAQPLELSLNSKAQVPVARRSHHRGGATKLLVLAAVLTTGVVVFVSGGWSGARSTFLAPSPNTAGRHGPHAAPQRTASVRYRLLWKRSLHANADSTSIVVPSVRTSGGKRIAVLVVLAGNNDVDCDPSNPAPKATTYVFNAANGRLLWSRSTTGKARCTTAAPAVARGWVYSPGLDGRIHRYALLTGHEQIGDGWPERFTRQTYVEKSSSNLVVSGPYLYLATSGFIGDAGHYEGHVVTVDLRTGRERVWNSLCSNIRVLITNTPGASSYCPQAQSGMFGRGQAAVDPLNRDVYVVTGNGPWNGHTDWGDSVLKLTPNGSKLVDAFTPTDQAYLNNNDLDLGSTGPAILPPVRIGGRVYNLLVQGGKGPATPGGPAVLWLVNRNRMSGKPGPGHLGGQLQIIRSPGGCQVATAPAVWTGPHHHVWVIYSNYCGVAGYLLQTKGGKPHLAMRWHFGQGSFTTPVVAGNILYDAHDGAVEAYNPATGASLWSSARSSAGGSIHRVHWEYPAVRGKMLFMTDETAHLYAYGRT